MTFPRNITSDKFDARKTDFLLLKWNLHVEWLRIKKYVYACHRANKLKITQSAGYDDTTRFSDLRRKNEIQYLNTPRTMTSMTNCRAYIPGKLFAVRHYSQSNLCSDLLATDALCTSERVADPFNSDAAIFIPSAIISLERRDTFRIGTSCPIRRSFFPRSSGPGISRARTTGPRFDDEESRRLWGLGITRRRRGRIPANSSGDERPIPPTRMRAGHYRGRIRGWSHPRPRDVRNSCWDCGCRHLMAPSSLLGEGRAKSRDHRLPLLEIPFPVFLSLCLSLSAISSLPPPLPPPLSSPSLSRSLSRSPAPFAV